MNPEVELYNKIAKSVIIHDNIFKEVHCAILTGEKALQKLYLLMPVPMLLKMTPKMRFGFEIGQETLKRSLINGIQII